MSSPLIQYIVLRRDLLDTLKWPIGALVAQGCHASVAALEKFRGVAETSQYLNNAEQMRKVVLAIADKDALLALSQKLAHVDHVVWEEHPEMEPTAIATRPYVKADIANLFKGLKCFS